MKTLYIIGVFVLFGLGCNQKNKQREKIILNTLDISIEVLKTQNEINSMSMKREYYSDSTHFSKYYKPIRQVNSYVNSFVIFMSKTNDINLIKEKYIKTLDSFSKLISFFEKDTIFNKYKSIIDTTFNYFNYNENVFKKKMLFDIYNISYNINYRICAWGPMVDLCFPRNIEIHSLYNANKEGDKYIGYIYRPGFDTYEEGVIIDSIKFNKKTSIPFKLYESVAFIVFDSVLKKGTYSVDGKLVFKFNQWDGHTPHKVFKVAPIKYDIKVD